MYLALSAAPTTTTTTANMSRQLMLLLLYMIFIYYAFPAFVLSFSRFSRLASSRLVSFETVLFPLLRSLSFSFSFSLSLFAYPLIANPSEPHLFFPSPSFLCPVLLCANHLTTHSRPCAIDVDRIFPSLILKSRRMRFRCLSQCLSCHTRTHAHTHAHTRKHCQG